jgi:hypothetical protein
MVKNLVAVFALSLLLPGLVVAQHGSVGELLNQVRAVAPKGEKHVSAQQAMAQLQKLPASQITLLLAGMDGANPLAENWLRGAVETVAARSAANNPLPLPELEKYLQDRKHSPRSRRLAFELLVRENPSVEKPLLAGLLEDTSLELRRDAVQLIIDEGLASEKAAAKEDAIKAYSKAFIFARDLDQIQLLGKKLKELEQSVDMPTRMGFLMNWQLLGPYDNVNDIGWDTVYDPETKLDYKAEYKGQKGTIAWKPHTTKDEFGLVDLTTALDKHKGAVAYAAAEFVSARDQSVVLRMGCITAHKVWVNGELVGANHVYHTGIEIDQYTFPVKLKEGKNVILLKICQNEQTEPWAQRWQFQLRVSDEIGGPILSQDREVPKTAAR